MEESHGSVRQLIAPTRMHLKCGKQTTRSAGASVDNDICFGLVGTLGVVMNEWWGLFSNMDNAIH